ncbi:MAG: hypothetical protein ACOC22_04610 [bacterium]
MNFSDLFYKVTWQVTDKVTDNPKPFSFHYYPFEDYSENEWKQMTRKEKEEAIEEAAKEEFFSRIWFEVTDYGID